MQGKTTKVDETLTGALTGEESISGTLTPDGASLKGTISMPPFTPVVTRDYNILENKPSYNGVTWEGDKTFEDMGDYNLSNVEIKAIFDRVFRKGGN